MESRKKGSATFLFILSSCYLTPLYLLPQGKWNSLLKWGRIPRLFTTSLFNIPHSPFHKSQHSDNNHTYPLNFNRTTTVWWKRANQDLFLRQRDDRGHKALSRHILNFITSKKHVSKGGRCRLRKKTVSVRERQELRQLNVSSALNGVILYCKRISPPFSL